MSFEAVVVEGLDDITDEGHAVLGDVIEAANERADHCGACFGGHDCLGKGKNEGDIGGDFARA